jgi:hypothetical protein
MYEKGKEAPREDTQDAGDQYIKLVRDMSQNGAKIGKGFHPMREDRKPRWNQEVKPHITRKSFMIGAIPKRGA